MGSASQCGQVLLPPSGRLSLCSEPSSRGCGQGVGSGGPCLQRLFQPWLTRVRARPCYPPLQDARPRNCLQLQTARPSALASDRNQSPNHFHGGQGEQPSPYCKVWGLPVAFGPFRILTGPGVHQKCCFGAAETCACCTSPFFVPDQDETSVSSEDFDMNDSTWMSADPHLASSLSPSQDERMRSPQNLHSQEDGE